jgi:hypothetical protein
MAAVLVALLVATALPAGAAPVVTSPVAPSPAVPTAASQGATFTFKQLGLAQSFSFASGGTTAGIQLPVPAKLHPSVLGGTLIVPPNFGTGTIVVNSGTQYIGSVNLPDNSDKQQVVPFLVSIESAPVVGSYDSFNLVLQQANAGSAKVSSTCSSALPLELTNPIVDYTGSFANPDTIASFFPPVLNQLILYVPPTPTPAEESAALTIAAGVADSYQQVPVAVSVQPLTGSSMPTLPAGALVRGIVIHQTGTAGINLVHQPTGNALLEVTGSATTLAEQGTLLTATIAKLVQTTSAVVLKPLQAPTIQFNPLTFSQLGLSATTTFSGQQALSLGIDETALGGVATSLAIDLKAEYTPVESGAKATAQVVVGGVSLANQTLDGSGLLDLPVTIPSALIQRNTTMLVNVSYFPSGFACNSATRTMTFSVDPRSTVQVTNAVGGQGGFPAIPQALIPNFEVAFATSGSSQLSSAVQTVCGLQRLSTVLLRPTVVSLKSAVNNQVPLLLIATAADVPAGMRPPLQSATGSKYRINDQSQGQFSMTSQVASLQVFDESSQGRTVVLASTSGSWQLMDRLFTALGSTSVVWSSLTGDVAAIGPQGNLVDLTIDAGGPQLFTAKTSSHTTTYVAIAAAFIVVLVLLIVWAVFRYRRRQTVVGGDEADSE